MKHGFTLIELLVVVLIIGILAAVALPQYNKAVEKSRVAEAITLLENIARGEQVRYLESGNFTPDLGQLLIEIPGTSGGNVSSVGTSYYTVALADGGARVTANRKGNAAAGPSLTFTVDSNGNIKRYCNESSSDVKLCDSVRQANAWEATEYITTTQSSSESQEAVSGCFPWMGCGGPMPESEDDGW